MSQFTRKQKVRLARSMMTAAETREGISIWESAAWLKRKEARTGVSQKPKFLRTLDLAALSRKGVQIEMNQKKPWYKRILGGNQKVNIVNNNRGKAALPQKVV